MVTAPIMEYGISINNQSITVNSENPIRASFNPPYNMISGTYKSTNVSLSRFEIRITAADADFDIDLGTRPYYAAANISANSTHEFSFEINKENFNLGDITYRISLYARSALDGTWDVTNVLFDLNGLQLDPSDEFTGIEVYSQKEPIDDVEANSYLSLLGNEDFTLQTIVPYDQVPLWDGTLEYSTDTTTWNTWDGTEISSADNALYLRGIGNTQFTGQYGALIVLEGRMDCVFKLTGSDALKIACKGNIESLLDYATVSAGEHPAMALCCYTHAFSGWKSLVEAPELPATTLTLGCYMGMFYGCTSLTTAPELPVTTLVPGCYEGMFVNCTSLTTAPELPATTVDEESYAFMFQGCTSLTTAPELPATTLASTCYNGMFAGCTSLTTAPALPATTLAPVCYENMFDGCTSLTDAPELPATTLVDDCYWGMFVGCTSLRTAPELPATTLALRCYQGMFENCTSLTTATKLPATTLASNCYRSMFSGCTSLTTVPELPATTLTTECYYRMFYGCRLIKLSATQTGEYQTAYRIPTTGTGTTATDATTYMFDATGGTFKETPDINTTYYTSNTIV